MPRVVPSGPALTRRPSANRASAVSSSNPSAAARAAETSSQLPAPRERLLERDVGQVVDRPVDVAADRHPRRGAPAHRPHRPSTSRSAPITPARPTSITLPSVRDVGGVEGDQRDDARDQQPSRREWQQPVAGLHRPEPGDQHADEEVGQHRIDERDRRLDLGVVEEGQRHAEAEQREQVEVDQPQGPARIDEGRQEEDAERQPDPEVVDVPRDRARVAAGELGVDLRAGPRLDDASARVIDHDLPDVGATRVEVVHLPLAGQSGAGARPGLEAAHRALGRQSAGRPSRSPDRESGGNPGPGRPGRAARRGLSSALRTAAAQRGRMSPHHTRAPRARPASRPMAIRVSRSARMSGQFLLLRARATSSSCTSSPRKPCPSSPSRTSQSHA